MKVGDIVVRAMNENYYAGEATIIKRHIGNVGDFRCGGWFVKLTNGDIVVWADINTKLFKSKDIVVEEI